MATSKFPAVWMHVPAKLMQWETMHPSMFLNPRHTDNFSQRGFSMQQLDDARRRRHFDSYTVAIRLWEYLRFLAQPGNFPTDRNAIGKQFILLFQNYEGGVFTDVVTLKQVVICDQGYPKLIFDHAPMVSRHYGENNPFWGAFILALAPVSILCALPTDLEPGQDALGEKFMGLYNKFAFKPEHIPFLTNPPF